MATTVNPTPRHPKEVPPTSHQPVGAIFRISGSIHLKFIAKNSSPTGPGAGKNSRLEERKVVTLTLSYPYNRVTKVVMLLPTLWFFTVGHWRYPNLIYSFIDFVIGSATSPRVGEWMGVICYVCHTISGPKTYDGTQ